MTIQECYTLTGSNYSEALRRLMREMLIKKFALKFLDDGSFALLHDSLAQADTPTAFRAAHTLKGVCQNLSFTNLAQSASACTEALRQGDLTRAKVLFADVEQDYVSLIDALRQVE